MNTIEKDLLDVLNNTVTCEYGYFNGKKECIEQQLNLVEKYAVGFSQWLDKNCVAAIEDDDKLILINSKPFSIEFSREELFKIYKQSLNIT